MTPVAQPGETPSCAAVILAGGRNTRMQGRNKALLEVDGLTLLDRLIATLDPIVSEIILVTRQPDLYGRRPVRIVEDIYEIRSSLTGIHAGLSFAGTHYAFVVPCDAPLLKPAVVRLLLDRIEAGVDAVVPVINGFYEPLCAVYSKACLAPIEAQFRSDNYKIRQFFSKVRLKTVSEEQLRTVDPGLHSFMNVNTPEEFARLKALIRRERSGGPV